MQTGWWMLEAQLRRRTGSSPGRSPARPARELAARGSPPRAPPPSPPPRSAGAARRPARGSPPRALLAAPRTSPATRAAVPLSTWTSLRVPIAIVTVGRVASCPSRTGRRATPRQRREMAHAGVHSTDGACLTSIEVIRCATAFPPPDARSRARAANACLDRASSRSYAYCAACSFACASSSTSALVPPGPSAPPSCARRPSHSSHAASSAASLAFTCAGGSRCSADVGSPDPQPGGHALT